MTSEDLPLPDPSIREPVLEVAALTRSYSVHGRTKERLVANDRISLRLYPGEVVAILGPNGAGKTTLLRQLGGLLLPTSGTIRVAGVDMIAQPTRAKQFLSVIPQECQPIESLTVEEHVRYFGLLKGLERWTARTEVQGILEQVGLGRYRDTLVRELSGGLKRRVLFAVALCGAGARVLLLDEPTTGLDPEARRSVWKVIDGLRARRIGILLTTHYIEEAEYLADRLAILNRGKIAAQGTVDEVRHALPYRGRLDIRGIDHGSAEARRAVELLERRWKTAVRTNGHARFEIPDPFSPETIAELANLTNLGLQASLSPVSLEDVYLSVVGALGQGNGA